MRASLGVGRLLLRPPPLGELEGVANHLEHLPFWSLINEAFQEPRMARLGGRLFRRLPRGLVYRCWIVPGFALQLLLGSLVLLRKHGTAFRGETGLGLASQLACLVERCCSHPGVLPEDVYIYGLHRPEAEAFLLRGAHNVHVRAVIDLASLAGRPTDDRFSDLLNDKRSFRRVCLEEDLPVPELVATFVDGRTEWTGSAGRLPERDLFVKPARATLGHAARRAFFDGKSRVWRLEPGRGDSVSRRLPPSPEGPLTAEALVAHLEAVSRVEPFQLQPRIPNHPDLVRLVGDTTLSTVRVITVRDRGGRCDAVGAFLRTSVTDSPIDAFAGGGLAASVDPATGRLGPAYAKMALSPTVRHPRTGRSFQDFQVPGAAKVLELCLRAHRVFGSRQPDRLPVVGWDVALMAEGPVLMEGNGPCDLQFQKLLGQPFWALETFDHALRSHLEPLQGRRIHLHPAFRQRVTPVQ